MALAFSETKNGVTYEVVTAGNSVRLYTNRSFHSQYNPQHVFTGAIWDLLALPSLAADNSPKDILVLGVGGGTVIHQLNFLHEPVRVIGVELDPIHIRIARRFFNLTYNHLSLLEADARDWLTSSRNSFDYIVDDVFLHGEVDPERPFHPDSDWCSLLSSRLRSGGAVVQNHIDAKNAKNARDNFSRQFDQALTFSNAMYSNTVVAGYKTKASRAALKKRVTGRLATLPKSVTVRLRHSIN